MDCRPGRLRPTHCLIIIDVNNNNNEAMRRPGGEQPLYDVITHRKRKFIYRILQLTELTIIIFISPNMVE